MHLNGFHLLVWRNGMVRVFGDLKEGHTFGQNHVTRFDGQWSLWMAIRVWWWSRFERVK
jgi:hypothetical protein